MDDSSVSLFNEAFYLPSNVPPPPPPPLLLLPSSSPPSLPHSPSFSTFAGVKRLLLGTTLSVLYASLNNYYPIEFLATKGFAVSTMISPLYIHTLIIILLAFFLHNCNTFLASEREQINFSRTCL